MQSTKSVFGTLDLQKGFSEKMDLNSGEKKKILKRRNGNEKQNKKPFGQVIFYLFAFKQFLICINYN